MIPSLPHYIFIDDSTLQRVNVPNVLRSEMSVGPQKTRPIQSIPLYNVVADISICDDKLLEFRTWFSQDLGSGAYWFAMRDPFDGTKRRFRFLTTEFTWVKQGNVLRTSIQLESYDEL